MNKCLDSKLALKGKSAVRLKWALEGVGIYSFSCDYEYVAFGETQVSLVSRALANFYTLLGYLGVPSGLVSVRVVSIVNQGKLIFGE